MSQSFPLTDPALYDVLQLFKQDILNTLNCVKVGSIQAFNAAARTVTVQLLFKKLLRDGSNIRFPLLVDCPVVTLQGGGGALQFPIAAGDQCLVVFSDSNIDTWFQTGIEDVPKDPRSHHLSDAIAIVGLNSMQSTLPAVDDNVQLRLPASKKLVISGGASVEALGTQMLALKSDVDSIITFLTDFVTKYNLHTHGGVTTGGGTTAVPTALESTPLPTMVGTTKLKGS